MNCPYSQVALQIQFEMYVTWHFDLFSLKHHTYKAISSVKLLQKNTAKFSGSLTTFIGILIAAP